MFENTSPIRVLNMLRTMNEKDCGEMLAIDRALRDKWVAANLLVQAGEKYSLAAAGETMFWASQPEGARPAALRSTLNENIEHFVLQVQQGVEYEVIAKQWDATDDGIILSGDDIALVIRDWQSLGWVTATMQFNKSTWLDSMNASFAALQPHTSH